MRPVMGGAHYGFTNRGEAEAEGPGAESKGKDLTPFLRQLRRLWKEEVQSQRGGWHEEPEGV